MCMGAFLTLLIKNYSDEEATTIHDTYGTYRGKRSITPGLVCRKQKVGCYYGEKCIKLRTYSFCMCVCYIVEQFL